jgi:eukaryotic-like serine/threonine-protein kinase
MQSDPRRATTPGDGQAAAADAAAHWARVKAVFFAAVELLPIERAAYLAGTCAGDPLLRAEVESLLARDASAGSFCEKPAASLFVEGPAAAALAPLPAGTVLGDCEIIGFLSAGGMGEVYRARHLLLDRLVALKTVRGPGADAAAVRRLLREARNAASLEHPGICRIYDVGVSNDVPWIVMPFITGRSIAELLGDGPLPSADLLSIAMQVAEALGHAHARGIVHRDLKSSNIMVDDDGRAIVLDFGVSRRLPRQSRATTGDATVTITGMLAGTLSHMAPEMLFGGEPDPRSDVWSFGVLLYEMAAGALPFQGHTAFETSAAILNDPPRPLPSSVPLGLRLIIERCLEKDPARRPASAGQVCAILADIRRGGALEPLARLFIAARRRGIMRAARAVVLLLAVAATVPLAIQAVRSGGIPAVSTLAVLPLDHADDPLAQLMAAGLTTGLIAQLGEAAEVRIIALGSSAIAAAEEASPGDAARQLGADAVLVGRLRRSGERILVDARLIAGSSGRVLWSDSFERGASQALALQADLAAGVVHAVRLALRPGADRRLATVRAVNPEAYEEYLRGRFEWNRRTPASLQQAAAHFERAIELDPTWAPGYAALADCYNQFGTVLVGAGSPREFRPRAEAAAIRALQIDPLSAEAHAALAYARHYDWHFAEAEQGFRRALELNPSHVLARIWYANLLMSRGRIDQALHQVQAARELDPFSSVVSTNLGWVLIAAGRSAEAVDVLAEVLTRDPTYAQARMRLIDALAGAGRTEEAHAEAHLLVEHAGDWPPALIALAINHARSAPDSARAVLVELLQRREREHVSSAGLAGLHDSLGDTDAALAWYARVLDERSNAAVYLRASDAATGARADPRLRTMLAAAGLD